MTIATSASTSRQEGQGGAVGTRSALERHFLHRGHGLEFEMEARWIVSQLPGDGARIADVGCGGGELFRWIGYRRVIGFDVLPAGLHYTRSRFHRMPLVAGCAQHLPAASASLDTIVMQHVLEHLQDVAEAARGSYRALRPAGRLIIVTPNAEFADPSVYHDPTHVHLFTGAELRTLLQDAGFEVVDLRTLGLPWFRANGRSFGRWRLRRALLRHAAALSRLPPVARAGQSLCCSARRPA